jgi:hypothetical protein
MWTLTTDMQSLVKIMLCTYLEGVQMGTARCSQSVQRGSLSVIFEVYIAFLRKLLEGLQHEVAGV